MTVSPAPPRHLHPVLPSLHYLHSGSRQRRTVVDEPGAVVTHFGELHEPLLRFISDSDVVVGCVAWITNRQILEALALRRVALVVQKEDWWKRSDTRGLALQRHYTGLTGDLPAAIFPAPLSRRRSLLPAIACLGYGNTKGGRPSRASIPLMHHKFVVRCHQEVSANEGVTLVPTAVWTGSFNFTSNANDSFENAVEVHDREVAAAYLAEFALVASLSEPMTWRLGKPTGKGASAKTTARPASATTAKTKPAVRQTAKKTAKKTATRTAKKTAKKTGAASPRRAAKKTAATRTRRRA